MTSATTQSGIYCNDIADFHMQHMCLTRICWSIRRERVYWQGYDVLFYGDSITMRWRDDWPADAWGNGPLPPGTPGGTPTGVFNATFRTKYTSGILGVGSTVPDILSLNSTYCPGSEDVCPISSEIALMSQVNSQTSNSPGG